MRRRWLLFAVILTVPSGCDNVAWGGAEVRLERPAGSEAEAPDSAATPAPEPDVPSIPRGPILLAGTRQGDSLRLVAVAEVRPTGLAALEPPNAPAGFLDSLVQERLAPGTELTLFAEGARVGRLTVGTSSMDARFCPARPTVAGVVELVPEAAEAERFLALADTGRTPFPYTPYSHHDHTYNQRVASISIAAQTIPQVGATWPESVLDSRADMQAFRLPEDDLASFAATFMYDDRLAVSRPAEDSYSLFIIGQPGPGGYQSGFTWYRRAADEGKGAPRYFDHLDWDRDGSSEILLDVFGAQQRWFAALSRRNGTWASSYQDPCGSPGA